MATARATEFRVLSVWQPWAAFLVTGAKRVETRSWSTSYRGWVLIHASKRWGPDQQALMFDPQFVRAAEYSRVWGLDDPSAVFTRGAIVGLVELTECRPTSVDGERAPWVRDLTELERRLGDYSPGRHGWCMSRPIPIRKPVPYTGRQGLWTPEDAVLQRVTKQIVSKE